MTISNETARNEYIGNGATTDYPYTFKIFQDSDLQVLQRSDAGEDVVLVLGSDYTVTGEGMRAGGTVHLASPLANGRRLFIRRCAPLLQPADIRNQGGYFPDVVEDALDRTVMIAQRQQDEIDRALRRPLTDPGGASGAYDANGMGIVGLRHSVSPQDAATRADVDSGDAGTRAYADIKIEDKMAEVGGASSQISANRTAAENAKSNAESARDQSVAASEASGDVTFFDTYADASASVPLDGQVVEVFRDETRNNGRTRYRWESGVLVFKMDFFQAWASGYAEMRAMAAGQAVNVLGRGAAGDGGGGVFAWRAGDQSANVAADPLEGVWVAPDNDVTGASGAWVRAHTGPVWDVRFWGAVLDGVADDQPALESAGRWISSNGGGTLLIAGDLRLGTGIVRPWSNVTLRGVKQSTRVFVDAGSTYNECFFARGPHPASYAGQTYYGLEGISAGDNVLTFITAGDAANFSPGNIVVLRSSQAYQSTSPGLMGDIVPTFVEIVKITAVDLVGGTVILERPIAEDVAAPLLAEDSANITEGGRWDFYGPIVESFSIENLTIEADLDRNGVAFRIRALYGGHLRSVVLKTSAFLGNALSHYLVDDVDVLFTDRAFEWKTGAYNSTFTNMRFTYIGEAPQIQPSFVDLGEYARDLTLDGFVINAHGRALSANAFAISFNGTAARGCAVRNGEVNLGSARALILLDGGLLTALERCAVENININVSTFNIGIEVNTVVGKVSVNNSVIRNVRVVGTAVPYFEDPPHGFLLRLVSDKLEISGCRIPGLLRINNTPQTPGVVLRGCGYDGISGGSSFNNIHTSGNYFITGGATVNGMGYESANAETPTASLWHPGTIVNFTDTGDGSGDGVYVRGTTVTWRKIA